jgi:hypothetical protein
MIRSDIAREGEMRNGGEEGERRMILKSSENRGAKKRVA